MGGLRRVRMKVAERDGGAPSAPAEPSVYRQPPRRGKPLGTLGRARRETSHVGSREPGAGRKKTRRGGLKRAGKAAVPPLPYSRMAHMARMDREAADGLKSAGGEKPSG
ncbi:hypothetical protein JCM14124_30920 [Humidesulfovibrio idahonensis]